MSEPIKALLFDKAYDNEVIELSNKYASLAKLGTKSAIRQLLLQVLPPRIAKYGTESQGKNEKESA